MSKRRRRRINRKKMWMMSLEMYKKVQPKKLGNLPSRRDPKQLM